MVRVRVMVRVEERRYALALTSFYLLTYFLTHPLTCSLTHVLTYVLVLTYKVRLPLLSNWSSETSLVSHQPERTWVSVSARVRVRVRVRVRAIELTMILTVTSPSVPGDG